METESKSVNTSQCSRIRITCTLKIHLQIGAVPVLLAAPVLLVKHCFTSIANTVTDAAIPQGHQKQK